MATTENALEVLNQQIAEAEAAVAHLKRQKILLLEAELAEAVRELGGSSAAGAGATVVRARRKAGKKGGKKAGGKRGGARKKGVVARKGRAAKKAAAAAEGEGGAGKGSRMSRAEAQKRLEKVVRAAGPEGISGRQAAKKAGVFYASALKILNSDFGKRGEGRRLQFFVEG